MTNEVVLQATDWKSLDFKQTKVTVANKWTGFQRRTLQEAWDIGRGLQAVKSYMIHGEWAPFLDSIGMNREMARRLLSLASGYADITQLVQFDSVDAALKALPPKRPQEPKPVEKPKTDQEKIDEAWEQDAQRAVDEVAEEEQAQQEVHDKEKRDERLAMRLENTDGDAVEVLNEQLDKKGVQIQEMRMDIDGMVEQLRSCRRKHKDVCDNLLLANPDTALEVIDEVLAKFYSVARK